MTFPVNVTLVDYGIGNLRSLEKAFEHVGARVERTSDPDRIGAAKKLVVPGVGAFGACADALDAHGLTGPVRAAAGRGVPLLGVCVGMQLLFEGSDERFGGAAPAGLGLLPGRVVRFADATVDEEEPDGTLVARRLKVPHMGWSPLRPAAPPSGASPLLDGLPDGAHVYFVHSYHAAPADPHDVVAWADYGVAFPAVVGRNRVFGVQFHPEKSQGAGLRILRNFAALPA